MPRKNRRQSDGPRGLPRDGASYLGTRRESAPFRAPGATGWADSYLVRNIGASAAVKYYLCPGCHQDIPPGVPHIVAWPDSFQGGDERRHWHTACWQRRGPGRR